MSDELNKSQTADDSPNPGGEFLLRTTEDGQSRVEYRFENKTIWLTQALIGELYDRSKKTISERLHNLFAEGELEADSVVRNSRPTATDCLAYNLPAAA